MSGSLKDNRSTDPLPYLWKVIERLKGSGKSIILTTHYLEEAQKLADRVCIMDRGSIPTRCEISALFVSGSIPRT